MKKLFLLLFYVSTIALYSCSLPAEKTPQAKSPNIIFILTDDLGYGDLGVLFQNKRKEEGKPFHSTPNLDKLANEGILLTRHYVPAPVCAPSRASLLLGQHQGHAEVRNNQFDKALPDNHTLASVLKEAGYATALIGKYGLQGLNANDPSAWEAYPTKRGFDYFFGYVRHRDGHNHYPAHKAPERPPMELYFGDEEISSQLKGCYTTDLFTAMAKKYIVDHKQNNPDQPFFMYLAYNTPHAGLQVASTPYPEGGGLKGGVQYLGQPNKYINTAIDTIDTFIHPDYASQDWPDVQKRIASLIRRIDEGVADVVQLLKDLKIDEETLIVFTSDNGPHHESYGYGNYTPTFFDNYGPLDGTKRDTWEGGIRVPTFVRWSGNIPAGKENDTPAGFHDWMPTFAQVANVPAPANTDGVSLMPILIGQGDRGEGTVYIEYTVGGATPEYERFHESHKGQKRGEMQVIYVDGYKGVRYDIQSASDDFRIYDTKSDLQEINNLAETSDYFKNIQQQMKDKVLQVRRPNSSAKRPYDNEPIPALEVSNPNSGLIYNLYQIPSTWVPKLEGYEAFKNGKTKNFDIANIIGNKANVVEISGLLQVQSTGEYTFNLNSNGKVVVHLHKALLFDADKGYNGETLNSSVVLEKGFHPFHVVFMKNTGEEKPTLKFEWSGGNISNGEVPSEVLFYVNN